jgi:transcriptional regulator with XRE-family HTH domain
MPHASHDNSESRIDDDLAAFQRAFGQVIVARESSLGISQRAFARRADISNTHLREIESGMRNLKIQTIQKLAIALGTKPSQLIIETEKLLNWD